MTPEQPSVDPREEERRRYETLATSLIGDFEELVHRAHDVATAQNVSRFPPAAGTHELWEELKAAHEAAVRKIEEKRGVIDDDTLTSIEGTFLELRSDAQELFGMQLV
jgi:hypothetical protein